MKKWTIIIQLVLALSLMATEAFSQQASGMGKGTGMGGGYGRVYNTSTVETVKGNVVSIEKLPSTRGANYGMHLTLKTEKETIPVHLGPGWYIENQEIKIEPNDKIEVKGSRIDYEGKPALIAAEVLKGDMVLKLRDQNGIPYWSGWRKKQR